MPNGSARREDAPAPDPPAPLLDVRGLRVEFTQHGRPVRPVEDVAFDLAPGETLALVGESGCGKTLSAMAVLGVAPPGARLTGSVTFEGRDLLTLSARDLRAVRGARIGFVFQEPMTALNPVRTVGEHIVETLEVHGIAAGPSARARAIELLREVALRDPQASLDAYPHQLSGGMQQRAMLALALACRPALLVADEPTTALDATTQAQIVDLLKRSRERHHLALLLVTHDLSLAWQLADRVAVMYAGHIVEQAPVAALRTAAVHPYTQGLLASVPSGAPRQRLRAIDGVVPDPAARPVGCAFRPRCPGAVANCQVEVPPLRAAGPRHQARCVLVGAAPLEASRPAPRVEA